jgi:endo-1,4-beta-mannosidase
VPAERRAFTLGVNYWPRRKAMAWWKAFDRGEVEAEFGEIATLGLGVVRIFLLWEDFQPAPDMVSERALADLGVVLDVALAHDLCVLPTFFTGHMSGVNWWPTWALLDDDAASETTAAAGDDTIIRVAGGRVTHWRGRDPYTDPLMLAAARAQVEAVCDRYGAHPAVWAWDLANEPDLFAVPRTYADGAAWNASLAAVVRAHSDRPVTLGMHLPSLVRYTGFRPDQLAPHNAFLSMHAYSIYYRPTPEADPLDPDVIPVAALATAALGGKLVLLEEFGYASARPGARAETIMAGAPGHERPQYLASDDDGGRFYTAVLERLARAGALGAFAWVFSDYAPEIWDRPPLDTHIHERCFGLTRADGTVKPSGEAMRAFAARAAAGEPPAGAFTLPRLDPEEWYRNPAAHFRDQLALYRRRL